jgi:hypothetical protein
MTEESPSQKKKGFSRFHLISLVLIAAVVVLIISMVYLQDGEENDSEEKVCGEDCHQENFAGYNDPQENSFMAAHSENEVDCWDCHEGEEVEEKEKESHGTITSESCEIECHRGTDWKIEGPGNEVIWHPHTDNGTSITDLEDLDSCIVCHDPRTDSSGLGAETCVLCHDISQEDLEDHGEDTCSLASCHSDSPEMRIDKAGHSEVKGHCNLCHYGAHPENAFVPYEMTIRNTTFNAGPPFCGSCHDGVENDLNETGWPHEVDLCTECHVTHDDHVDCLSCHDGSDIPHQNDGIYSECQDCHINGGHEPENVEFHAFSEDSKSESFCGSSSCHLEDVFNVVNDELDGELHGKGYLFEDCIRCHGTHSEDVDCFACHEEGKDPPHNIQPPFDDCTGCHVDGHDNSNITFIQFNGSNLNETFCEDCHEGVYRKLQNEGPEHIDIPCQTCHENARGKELFCDDCHKIGGSASPPDHSVASPFDQCGKCHITPHDPQKISTFGVTFSNNDFCASCHSDPPNDQVPTFSQYGGRHKTEVVTCTPLCHKDHIASITCTDSQCHSSSGYPQGHADYRVDECFDCHRSAHDPANSRPMPGISLSQKDYMENYNVYSKVYLKNTFAWVVRGNHTVGKNCTLCHDSAVETRYTPSSLLLVNSTGVDCSENCHGWIDPVNTQYPFVLLNSSSSNHTQKIFNNASRGGCAGFCHQEDPGIPDLSNPRHGALPNCLNDQCHGKEFTGGNQSQGHRDHEKGLEDAQVDCFSVCHTDIDSNHDDCVGCHAHYAIYGRVPATERLADGGCYGCHKSGHDPKLVVDNPCSECH